MAIWVSIFDGVLSMGAISVPKNQTVPVHVTTHDPTTGNLATPTSGPSYDVYNEAGTVVETGSFVSIGTGKYRLSIATSSATYVIGSYYTVVAQASFSTITQSAVILGFRVDAAESVLGVPKVDIDVIEGSTTASANLEDFLINGYSAANNRVFADTLAVSGSTTAADNLEDFALSGYDATNNRVFSDVTAITANTTAATNLADMTTQAYSASLNRLNANVTAVNGEGLDSMTGPNFDFFFNNNSALTTKVVDDIGAGGAGGTDWTQTERDQIRWRLGVDGSTNVPITNIPHLGTVDANIVQIQGSGTAATNFQDMVLNAFDSVNNWIRSDVVSVVASTGAATNLQDFALSGFDTVSNRVYADLRAANGSSSIVDSFVDMYQFAYSTVSKQLDVDVQAVGRAGIGLTAGNNFQWFFDNFGNDTVKVVDNVGGSGGSFWTPTEQQQIRFRLGIDGTESVPTNTPDLGILPVNTVLISGSGSAPLNLVDLLNEGYDSFNNRLDVNLQAIDGVNVSNTAANNWQGFFHNLGIITTKIVDDVGGGTGGDATLANQTAMLTHLTEIKGSGWTTGDTLRNVPVNVWSNATRTVTSATNITEDGLTIKNVYTADIMVNRDTGNDDYSVIWFKNGVKVAKAAISNATISATDTETGGVLFVSQAMSQVANEDAFYYQSTSIIPFGTTVAVRASATIDSASREWVKVLERGIQ